MPQFKLTHYQMPGAWTTLKLESQTALLSQEGSGIAKRIPRGVVPLRNIAGYGIGTTPALRATPPH